MKVFIYISFLLVSIHSFAQLTTTAGQAPTSLVQNVLLGNGVSVSNVTYNGSPSALGSFSAVNSNLGIASGIIITTGTILNTGDGPHGPNNRADAGIDNGFPGSALLASQLSGATTYNAATLEFDFIPYSDTVRFNYVFGSEEYPEFVGTTYNDIFGFFISGPGIAGVQNIATIPGGGGVVAINNVNNGNNTTSPNVPASNPQFYVSNAGGTTIQYDGFTKVLTAVSKVNCGQTYHLRIAIADVGDGIYDSGIFLEANSLSSKTPVEITSKISYHAFADTTIMAEGCVTGTVQLTRRTNTNVSLTVPITVGGTATSMVDYAPAIPNSVTFAPGETVKTISFTALADGMVEGIETIDLNFNLTDPCGNVSPILIRLKIDDIQSVNVTLADTSVFCPSQVMVLNPVASGGVGPYTYVWSTGATTASISVNPASTTSYTVTVTDNCLMESASTTATVTVPVYPPLVATTSGDVSVLCPFIKDTLFAFASGGTGSYTYRWFANNTPVGLGNSLIVIPPTTTLYTVVVKDQCNQLDTAYVQYEIQSPPLLLTVSDSPTICPGEAAPLMVSATGGYGQYYYLWPKTGETTSNIVVNPLKSAWFVVEVSDDCQTFIVLDSIFVKVVKPIANFAISSQTVFSGLPITFQNLTINGSTYQWDFGDGNTSTLIHPNNTFLEAGAYTITLIARDDKGCLDTVVKGINILLENYIYVPNAFTPDGDRFNNYFRASTINIRELNVRIYSRWGELMFESNDPKFAWDGIDQNGKLVQQGVYTYIITYSTPYEIDRIKEGHVLLMR